MKKVIIPAFVLIAFAVIVTVVWWFARSKVSSVKDEPKPISILIADFENITGDPVFDGAIETALNLGLKGASFISSYDRSTALKIASQMGLNPEEQLDSEIAQAVCRREGIDLVLTGSIESSGKGYTIKTWTLYPTKSEKFAEVSQEITEKSEVLKETDKLANQLASKLGGVKLRYKSHSTTTSLEAMNAFSKALSYEKQGKDKEAIQEYLLAIQKDPRFGMAYGNLAVVYYNLGQEQKAVEYFKMAMTHLDRISETEKNEIRSKYYLITRNYKKAIESFKVILDESPQNGWALTNIAFAYFFARDMKKAVEEGKKAVELDPENVHRRYNLVWYAMGAGDFELADKEAGTLLNQNPDFAAGYVCYALLKLIQGHNVQANDTYQKLKNLNSHGSSLAKIGIADLAIYEGRLADAKQILEDDIEKDIENDSADITAEKLIMLAQTFLLQGKNTSAIDTVDRAIDLSKKVSVMFSAAKTFIDTGQEKRATALSEYLAEQIYPEYQAYAKLIEAEVKRSRNDITAAIRLIEEANTLVDTWLGRFALGCAYLEAGAFAEAHAELELCIKRRGEAPAVFFDDIPSCRYFPPVYYHLARAQEGMNSPSATESYQIFLKIKKNADPGIAEVEDARKRLDGLK